MKECAFLGSDVDESGLNAGKDRFYLPQINVADHPPCVRTVDKELDKLVILQDRDTGLPRVCIDEDLSLHTHTWPELVAATRRARRPGTFRWWRRS
jgi:hypothetical protein